MYYYIFESSSTNNKINDLEEKIRDYVANLGIAGEMTAPSHARSLEYLIVFFVPPPSETLKNFIVRSEISMPKNGGLTMFFILREINDICRYYIKKSATL